jgi:hypothetical protein
MANIRQLLLLFLQVMTEDIYQGTINKKGTAAAQWLRYCATNQKAAGSIPYGVMNFSLT